MAPPWSKEEDEKILEMLSVDNMLSVTMDMIKEHNDMFGVLRTDASYKVRVSKVAKENNIDRVMSRQWTDDEKEYVMKVVSEEPLCPKWAAIAVKLNRSELMVKKIYNDNTSTMDHVKGCIRTLNINYIEELTGSIKHGCIGCSARIYAKPYIWEGNVYCDECHYMKYNSMIMERWISIHVYAGSSGKNKCNICEKGARFNTYQSSRFHFDHINMFDKEDSIYSMVHDGTALDDIYREIDKCQLLCASCHAVVTKVETQCGFIGLKRELNRLYVDTTDDSRKDELKREYSSLYEDVMTTVYKMIKETV